jgi:hypothetical protein
MRHSLAALLIGCLFLLPGGATHADQRRADALTVPQLLALADHCPTESVLVAGFVHSSRHGAWITQDSSIYSANGHDKFASGVPLKFADSVPKEKNMVSLQQFVLAPRQYTVSTLEVRLFGRLNCLGNRQLTFSVESVDSLRHVRLGR